MSDSFLVINQKNLECQRHIYIADILRRFIVGTPSSLNSFPLSLLRILYYSKADFTICVEGDFEILHSSLIV